MQWELLRMLWLREPSSPIVCFLAVYSYFLLSQGHSPKIVHLTFISIMWEMYLMAFSSICPISHLPRFFWSFHIRSQRAWTQVIFMQDPHVCGFHDHGQTGDNNMDLKTFPFSLWFFVMKSCSFWASVISIWNQNRFILLLKKVHSQINYSWL